MLSMRTQFAIDYYGGRTGLAKALGIDRTAICHWGEEVPELRQYQLQVLTKGDLVAEKNTATHCQESAPIAEMKSQQVIK